MISLFCTKVVFLHQQQQQKICNNDFYLIYIVTSVWFFTTL